MDGKKIELFKYVMLQFEITTKLLVSPTNGKSMFKKSLSEGTVLKIKTDSLNREMTHTADDLD